MAKKKTKKQRIILAAENLNEVLGLEPAIETEDRTAAEIAEKVLEASELLYPDDEIKPGTQKVIDYLKMKKSEATDESDDETEEDDSTEEKEESTEEESEEDQEDEEDSEEDEPEEDVEPAEEAEEVDTSEIVEKINSAKNRTGLLKIAMSEEIFAEMESELPDLKEEDALRKRMLGVIGEPVKKDPPKSEKKATPKPKKKSEKKEEKSTSTKKKKSSGKKRKTRTEKAVEYITPFIEEGTYQEKELVDMIDENCDIAWSTAHMLIAKARNPKYNKFDRLLEKDDNGLISFAE